MAEILDLLVIGGGPHGLACVSRLFEDTPAALYTDFEHSRLHWLQRRSVQTGRSKRVVSRTKVELGDGNDKDNRASARCSRTSSGLTGHRYAGDVRQRPKVLVLDKQSSQFMGTWNTLFEAFHIQNLRSPMFFHPHPGDFDALKSYACAHRRENELVEIGYVVGMEWSKHQRKAARIKGKPPRQVHVNIREKNDYYTPSTSLFRSFVEEEVVSRYNVDSLINQDTVTSLTFIDDRQLFEIYTSDGRVFFSKAVVMAIGPGAIPNVPQLLSDIEDADSKADTSGTAMTGPKERIHGEEWCHTSAFLDKSFELPIGNDGVLLLIGGGLTSAYIVELALSRGYRKVIMFCRSGLKVKPFDMDSAWVGKYSNLFKMMFYQESDPSKRLEQYHQARNGGSMPAPNLRVLRKLEASGRLEIHVGTEVNRIERRSQEESERVRFHVSAKTSVRGTEKLWELEQVDYVVAATGSRFAIKELPFLQNLHKSHPIETLEGFPVLTEDLQWRKDVPLFVMGGYAGLQLGPGGLNLIGAKDGSERIANALEDLWPETWGEEAEWKRSSLRPKTTLSVQRTEVLARLYRRSNHGNRYDVLVEEGSERRE
ncbi:hypothetical protein K435DRAFT_735478 [Dendrothele bispora CBS 962.96]|uniref:Uncharacterized protein n=1 Tax=Dendrothele bispora (strain CBS 962.96) TaxID=1314807 RepID=A0A4S8KZ90_DENBC|nr:hypothetical protein K435DRAFT_735478 [Dendrothele bispora CBS 962.96]